MQKIIGVRFKKAGKIHLFDPGDDDIQAGDSVIVETSRGLECGDVVIGVRELPQAENPAGFTPTIRRIHRKATKADLARVADNHQREQEALLICEEKIAEHNLPMNLIGVRYTFDINKIIFYFTSDGRVDFRYLVRDLAYIFRTRIELRQVGVREEAKALGGVGCCGRKLCCSSFLGDFAQVSIRMAKEQNLSLNPTKISGICGRLLCCLKFESEYYHECYMKNHPMFEPTVNDRVILDEGGGRVIAVNALKKVATVLLDTKKTVTVNWEDIMPADGEVNVKFPDDEPQTLNDDEFNVEPISIDAPDENNSAEKNSVENKFADSKPAHAKNFGRKNFNRDNNFSAAEKTEQVDEDKRPWINRPRKPRRPRGNFRG
ncbi:MAG: stage 0 sporulation family protein [Selenomonadaceae bacterium]|nr:stage 0 sporulation family protein [Selenomonadaceae bacterium]